MVFIAAGGMSAGDGTGIPGEITGIVRDSLGGLVPGASIEATNLATNEVSKAVTNESGYYALPMMAIGKYRVTARQRD